MKLSYLFVRLLLNFIVNAILNLLKEIKLEHYISAKLNVNYDHIQSASKVRWNKICNVKFITA